jgi:crotonobetainyl-CoA:carnitine CoA-transferase CaiB-like acyl-CoA transferase
MLPPGSNNSFDYRMDDIPAVGQHTEAILSEIGIAASEIEAMRLQKAI